jgi:putative ABC transport system permease protein
MKALDTKLWRDLQSLWAQVLTIAVVVAIGAAGFVGMFSVHESLKNARDNFYRDNRMADVFIRVQRAPLQLQSRLRDLPGVADVQLSVVHDAQLALPDAQAPVTGRFIGLDLARLHAQRQGINALTLRSGRWPEPGRALEAVVNERFAQARHLKPGDQVQAILNGQLQTVHLVGTVISPEYVFASRGGAPDDKSFGVWWIDQQRMVHVFDMQGAFNQAAFRVHDSIDKKQLSAQLITQVDALLAPYGTRGAMRQDQQISARIVNDELSQMKVMGTVLPAIFLAVSVFILNGVIGRQVATQRQQMAALKALGYPDRRIAGHYMGLALAISGLGLLAGLLLSQWIGHTMLGLYGEVFRLAHLDYATTPWLVAGAVALVLAAATAGTWRAIRAVVRLRPAVAMQAPAPDRYRPSLIERLGLGRYVSASTLMAIRHMERRPWRALFTVTGIALAVALQISGAFWLDAIDHIVDVQYRQVLRGDVVVNFQQALGPSVQQDLLRLPGVMHAEVQRSEAVRLHAGSHNEEGVLLGLAPDARLMRVIDAQRGPVTLPAYGLVLSALLARQLGVQQGEQIEVEFLMGRQHRAQVQVIAIVHTLFGKQAFMDIQALHRLAREGAGVTEASLQVDPMAMPAFWQAVKQVPVIVSVLDKASSLAGFQETTSRNMGVFSTVLSLFAVAMAVGIVYNAARISLSEHAWELASLRVLGMTRAEVSVLLLAPLTAELLLALPLGAVCGWALASWLMHLMSSDNIDFPVVIAPDTYAWAALIVLAAGLVSALLVRRQIDRLELVAVLKVRE